MRILVSTRILLPFFSGYATMLANLAVRERGFGNRNKILHGPCDFQKDIEYSGRVAPLGRYCKSTLYSTLVTGSGEDHWG
jgi:hypothetical protein